MNQEPIDIHGVIAFPNPDGQREIRFIDSTYNTLFKVPDGSAIIMTDFEGNRKTLICQYIDDYHTLIGGRMYHICQFAEEQERHGAVYEPKDLRPKYQSAIYEIYQISDTRRTNYCFREFDAAQETFQAADYRKVYAGMLAKDVSLDDLFAKHNADSRPFGRKMRSMSVSDVVVIRQRNRKKAYYVEPCGFRNVSSRFFQRQKERGETR